MGEGTEVRGGRGGREGGQGVEKEGDGEGGELARDLGALRVGGGRGRGMPMFPCAGVCVCACVRCV